MTASARPVRVICLLANWLPRREDHGQGVYNNVTYRRQAQPNLETKFFNAARPCLQSSAVSPKPPDLTNGDEFSSAESDSSISRKN